MNIGLYSKMNKFWFSIKINFKICYNRVIIAYVRKHLFTELDISSITPGVPGELSLSQWVTALCRHYRHAATAQLGRKNGLHVSWNDT